MKVVVTGGAGQIGSYVVDRLKGKHEVTILDVRPSAAFPEVPVLKVDLLDREQTLTKVKGFDAVVHLAAIPNPFSDPGDRVLSVNVTSTYNLMEAIKANHISRIVYCCSESSSGWGIHHVNYKPQYIPIDEAHPSWPHESYSLSKYFSEEICREYSRAYKIEAISLRYAWVWLEATRSAAEKFLAAGGGDLDCWFGAHILPEDVAQAVEHSLSYSITNRELPFEMFYLTAGETFCKLDSLEQVKRIFGTVPTIKKPGYFEGDPRATLFDISKAKTQLGFKPEFSWRDYNSPRRRKPGV
jgi:nucleoside-diphosphate-sugar epimerase